MTYSVMPSLLVCLSPNKEEENIPVYIQCYFYVFVRLCRSTQEKDYKCWHYSDCLTGAVCFRLSLRSWDKPGFRRFKRASPQPTERVQTPTTSRWDKGSEPTNLILLENGHKQCGTKHRNLMSGFVACRSYLASGPNGFSVHQQHRLGQRAAGTQHPRGDHPAEDPVSAGQRAVLRLRPGRPSLGLHQPGHPAVHRVLRHPQVERHFVSLWIHLKRKPRGIRHVSAGI